jgi:hypothetical protein
MIAGGHRATTAPITAKISADNSEVACKQRRHAAPHQVRLRKAVQQEDRRPGATRAHEDAGLARLNLGRCEVIHHFKPKDMAGVAVDIYAALPLRNRSKTRQRRPAASSFPIGLVGAKLAAKISRGLLDGGCVR